MNGDLRLLHWPAEDRASFGRFAAVMADVQARIQAISGDASGVPVPRPPRVATPRECAAMILKHHQEVRVIAGGDADMFGDPAWEIALAVFHAEGQENDAALLEMAGLSPSCQVGGRWIKLLLARGWVERRDNGHLHATEKMITILNGYFTRL
ncbi:hypothetical protein [Sphingomonas parapaucimobilis]|uniref:Uncharacterized protein n=1 Tax=Sphingomonas parapaucimobilis NBRC 15100 TaxID=1219049 RepID=A0A0A1W4B0_9SPHN|nr:hypothetical protein [Sphingomonas parapaucimobilis]GAM00240.1 hypothetical protein SP5_025_00480 [Sphingomonas parapaucimobilis NBRC 15100]